MARNDTNPHRMTPRFIVAIAAMATLFSCHVPAETHALAAQQPDENHATETRPLDLQLFEASSTGLLLDFETLDIDVRANEERGENDLDLHGALGYVKLDRPSLHGLNFYLDAPVRYNGIRRDINLALVEDNVYFSLDADAGASYDFKYTSSLQSVDLGEVDAATRGISYYEYGDLDRVLGEILEVLDISSSVLDTSSLDEKLVFDWGAIFDSMETVEFVSAGRYRWDVPIGDDIFPVGLIGDEDNVLCSLELPIAQNGVQNYVHLENGVDLRLKVNLSDGSGIAPNLPHDASEYHRLSDSLSLFTDLARLAKRKTFGLEAHFGSIVHTEDAIVGDDSRFSKDPVNEACRLDLSAQANMSESLFGGIHVDATLAQQGGNSKNFFLHTEDNPDGDGTDFYLNVNDVLKAKTNSGVANSLLSALGEAFGDESIQNASIKDLLNSLLATLSGIESVVDAVRESPFYQNIDQKHFESVIATLIELTATDNQIFLKLDLTQAGLTGHATVTLKGSDLGNAPLARVDLHDVGFRGSNDAHTTLKINGYLEVLAYSEPSFVPDSSYKELTHLPGWDEEIRAIAQRDQLAANIEGYVLTQGTTSKATATTRNKYVYGRSEQGIAFSGNLAFDLVNRLGTGALRITDLKEKYVNDHTVKIDLTGEASESDTDANDMKGSGNANAMFFEYNSTNVTATNGSTAYNQENRADPDNKNGLKGRFSVHSLNGILDVIMELSDSTDVRFERLTNLVSTLSAETLLTKMLDGEYFELLTSRILESVDIQPSYTAFVVAPGIIQQNSGLTLKLGYDGTGKPKTIEVWMTMEGDTDKDLYVKITLGATSFDSFPYQFSDHTLSNYTDYSSIKTLAEFGIGSITLGVTDASALTTYHISGTVALTLISIYTVTVTVDLWIYLDGTNVKILGAVYTPYVLIATNDHTQCNIFYETDGSDTNGTLYIHRLTSRIGGPGERSSIYNVTEQHRKIRGSDFAENMVDWLCGYILNLGDTIMNRITDNTDSADTPTNGEDLIEGFSVTNQSLTTPGWQIKVDLGELAHNSLLGTLTATITGKTATYSSGGKSYSKKTLYSLVGNTNILGSVIEANINLTMANVSSSGAYSDAWNSGSAYLFYTYDKSEKVLFWTTTYHYIDKRTGTAKSLWNGSYGKNSSNAKYNSASWYTKP